MPTTKQVVSFLRQHPTPTRLKLVKNITTKGGTPNPNHLLDALKAYHAERGETQQYNFHTEINGGPGRRSILLQLSEAGIIAEPRVSAFMGMTAVMVYGGKQAQRRAEKIVYGDL